MYNNGSDKFNELISQPGSQSLKTRMVFSEFNIEDVINLKYFGGSNNSDNINVGTTTMAYVEAEVSSDKILTNQEFLLEAGFLINGEYEYAPLGYFTVQLPEDDETISFKAYDRMQKFEKPYNSSLTFPIADSNVVNEICSLCGIELATPITNPIIISEIPQGYTCREILGYIAGIHGFFACIDRYGKLNLRWYSTTPIEKQLSIIWSLNKSQSDFSVSKVTMAKDSETIYTSGTGVIGIETSNPLATQSVTNNVYNALNGYTYRPCEISMLDDIRLDPWDLIKVVYFDGTTYLVPVMKLEQNFTSGETVISAFGKTEVESEYSYQGPLTNAIERTATELLIANRVIATKVDAEWVEANTITVTELEATNARIDSLEANSLTVAEADIRYADITLGNIDTANINKANIGLLFSEVGLLTSATIEEGHVTGYLDSVKVNANSITAGTLSTDRLIIRNPSDPTKSIIYEINNISGALQAVQGNTLNGEVLTDRSINVDKIVAGSITANELNVANIFGNSAVLNTITSSSIFANAIATNSVVVGASSNALEALNTANSAKKQIYHTASNGAGTAGYFYLAQIKIKSSYASQPIKISIVQRGSSIPSTLWIAFANSAGVDPGLRRFAKTGTANFYIAKSATSTWDLYVQKLDAHDSLSVTEYEMAPYMAERATLTWKNATVKRLPSGYVTATQTIATAEWCYENNITYINGGKIYTGTVTANAIAANAVTTDKLAASAVTADKLNVSSLSAITADLGTVTAGKIDIETSNLADNYIYLWSSKKTSFYTAIGTYRVEVANSAFCTRMLPEGIDIIDRKTNKIVAEVGFGRVQADTIVTSAGASLNDLYTNIQYGVSNPTNDFLIFTDGSKKQVYTKRFTLTLTSTNDHTLNIGIAINNIFDIRAFAYKSGGGWFPMPYVGHTNSGDHNNYDMAIYCDPNSTLHIKPYSSARVGYMVYITVYYVQ